MKDAALANLEAEGAVLGRIINDYTFYWSVCDRLSDDDFSDARNRSVWAAIKRLIASGKSVTPTWVVAEAGDRDVAFASYVAGLSALAAKSQHVSAPPERMVELVQHYSGRRSLLAASDRIREMAETAPATRPIEDVRQEAQRLVAANDREVVQARSIGAIVNDFIMAAQKRVAADEYPGIRTGLLTFDQLVGSMLPGQLIVLAGETSSGKTALAMQLAYMAAIGHPARDGCHVYITSLEMTADELIARYLTRSTGIASERILGGELTKADMDIIAPSAEPFLDLPIAIDDQPRQTVGMIEARLARSQAAYKTKLAIVDHLQYVRSDIRRDEREQTSQVVNDLKAMAKRRGLPVILISHVARPFEQRVIRSAADIRMPALSMLHGSSAIEKAADVVLFVHRRCYFLERAALTQTLSAEGEMDLVKWSGKAELVLLKRRMGVGHGKLTCAFDGKRTWFTDTLAKDEFL